MKNIVLVHDNISFVYLHIYIYVSFTHYVELWLRSRASDGLDKWLSPIYTPCLDKNPLDPASDTYPEVGNPESYYIKALPWISLFGLLPRS